MPICIECCYPVPQLYHVLSSKKKSSQPGGGSISSHGGNGLHNRNTSSTNSSGHATTSSATAAIGGGLNGGPNGNIGVGGAYTSVNTGGTGGSVGGGPGNGSSFKGGGEAKKKSSGGLDVRLMQCPRCKRFADKYVEHDLIVLFIDLVLVKPQVYRHLLFNRLTASADHDRFDPAIQRLGVLLVLFDVYLTWSAVETSPVSLTAGSFVPQLPILGQYLFYLILCSCIAVTQHAVIRELSQLPFFRGTVTALTDPMSSNASPVNGGQTASAQSNQNTSPKKHRQQSSSPTKAPSPQFLPSRSTPGSGFVTPQSSGHLGAGGSIHSTVSFPTSPTTMTITTLAPPPSKISVSTAIFVSSCMKLFPILMVVWKYEDGSGQLARGVSWAVALQNVEALRILLGCGYGAAGMLIGLGWIASSLVGRLIMASVGLQGQQWGLFTW